MNDGYFFTLFWMMSHTKDFVYLFIDFLFKKPQIVKTYLMKS